MKIGLISYTFSPAPMTGPIRHVGALAKGLAKRGHEVAIVTSLADVPPRTVSDETEAGVHVIRLRVVGRWGHWIRCPALRSTLANERFDIVHSQGYRNYFTDVAASFSTATRTPFIITPRGSLLGYRHIKQGWVRALPNIAYDAITLRRALRDAVLVVSSAQEKQDALAIGLFGERIRVIPYGIDRDQMPVVKAPRRGTGTKFIFVGRIAFQRNLEFLIRAFSVAVIKRPALSLTLVGEHIPSRYNRLELNYPIMIRKLVADLAMQSKVRFTGPLRGRDLWEAYMASDIFVYTSRYDNFGHALVEAASLGLPIISTSVGVAPDLVGGSAGGILVGHDDISGLANAMVYASSNPQWREQKSSFLLERSKQYDLDANVKAH